MSKWEKFHSSYSPVEISKANTGRGGNLQADWFREQAQGRMTINGEPIKKFAEQYDEFKTISAIDRFFKEVILKDMVTIDETKRQAIADYLKTSFHQGGYMYPVSGSLAVSMEEYSEESQRMEPFAVPNGLELVINIQTTPDGFKLQEFVSAKRFVVTELFCKEFNIDIENPLLSPEEGHDYAIKAQGIINIDFSESNDNPRVEIESNTISYGHSAIQAKMDNRTVGQMIMDFFKNILGLNTVEVFSLDQGAVEEVTEEGYACSEVRP